LGVKMFENVLFKKWTANFQSYGLLMGWGPKCFRTHVHEMDGEFVKVKDLVMGWVPKWLRMYVQKMKREFAR
jgi:hypothetical protein